MIVLAIAVIVLMCAGFLFTAFALTTKERDGGKHMLANAILAILCFVIANVVGVLGVIYKLGGM